MNRFLLIICLSLCTLAPVKAQYYGVNYDPRTVAAMAAAFNTEAATEA